MKTDTIRVGIIGANPDRGWAVGVHVPALKALPDYAITAVATTRTETAEAAAKKFGARAAYTDSRKLAADPNVDLVVVSVKTPGHHAHVRAALEAGKAVFCEWPLAANMEEVRDLVSLARTKGLKGFIGVQARCAPVLAYARDLVAQGYVGRVLAATMTSATAGMGAVADSTGVYLLDKKNGATTLSIPGGHTLDALCSVLGEFRDVTGLVATQVTQTKIVPTGEVVP